MHMVCFYLYSGPVIFDTADSTLFAIVNVLLPIKFIFIPTVSFQYPYYFNLKFKLLYINLGSIWISG